MSAGEKAFWVRVGWSFMKRGRCFNQWATVLYCHRSPERESSFHMPNNTFSCY